MPYAFIFVGIVMIVSGVRGSASALVTLLESDLTGSDNFGYWILAILAIGALGYVEDFKSLSRAFLALVLVVLVLAEDKGTSGGFFTEFTSAFKTITGGSASTVADTSSIPNTSSTDAFDSYIEENFSGLVARPTN